MGAKTPLNIGRAALGVKRSGGKRFGLKTRTWGMPFRRDGGHEHVGRLAVDMAQIAVGIDKIAHHLLERLDVGKAAVALALPEKGFS